MTASTVTGNLRLTAPSPANVAGNLAANFDEQFDLSNHQRIVGCSDLGSYEMVQQAPLEMAISSITKVTCRVRVR